MGTVWQTLLGVAVGGAISLVTTYLNNLWQARRELERHERERRERLHSELRAERKAVAAELWGVATTCHYLIYQVCQVLDPDSEELKGASRELTAAVQRYMQARERNALWLEGDPEAAKTTRELLGAFRALSVAYYNLSGLSGLFAQDTQRVADKIFEREGQAQQQLASAYPKAMASLRRFAGLTTMEQALEQQG